MRNLDENGVQQSPGWSREALEFLIHERHVKAVGHGRSFDTDAGIPAAEHGLVNEYYLLEQNIYQVEVLNQLDQVPAVGALISIAFPHWDKATGSPVRAVAILYLIRRKNTEEIFGVFFLFIRRVPGVCEQRHPLH